MEVGDGSCPYSYPFTEWERGEDRFGLSLYEVLARHHTGDTSNYLNVLNGILDLYLRIWANPIHPDLDRVRHLENLDCRPLKTFFNALACPDAIEPDLYDQVVGFIADAMNVRIRTWTWEDEAGGPVLPVSDVGESLVPIYDIVRTQRYYPGPEDTEERIFHFDSLVEDETGTPLMNFLEDQKRAMDRERRGETQTPQYNGLELKKICWWWRTNENGEAFDQRDDGAYETGLWWPTMRWYNEHIANSPRAPRLNDVRDSLAVFTVSVSTPDQIRPALRLLSDALDVAPAQEIPVNPKLPIGAGGKRSLRRYVGIDAEFVQRWGEIGDAPGNKFELEGGNPEHLCSILTVAVDRHLVFSFYIMHMLDHPTEETVPQLSALFEELLFGTEYLKVWWNYGEDFAVLDATIAHMFQGTPRARYLKTPWRGDPYWVEPFYKVKSAHYDNERPPSLTFSRDSVECKLHAPGENELGMACPCRLGNVDLSTILDEICRQLGLASAANAYCAGVRLRQWSKAKFGNNYALLLQLLLGQDRIYPLLNYLKEGAARSGDKDEFYQSLGLGMETNIDKMGYNIGDVVGIALIMRYLTTTDDRLLLAGRLSSYAFMEQERHLALAIPQRLARERSSTLEIPQIEDNPRLGHRARLTQRTDIAYGFETSAINTAWNTYVRHEEVASCARERWGQTDRRQSNELRRENAIRNAYLDALDPTEFSLPESIFTLEPPTGHEDCANKRAIVRTGKTHSSDLLDFIRSRRSRKTLLPRGFLAAPDSELSLPVQSGRQAGQSLEEHAEIAAAFALRNDLEPGRALPRRQGVAGYINQPRPTINTVVGPWGDTGETLQSWDQGRIRREAAERQTEANRIDTVQGPPAEYRPDLIFDPDGRQHNLNITTAGSLKSQIYSPWDVARPPTPGQLPDNVLQQLRVLLDVKEWNPDENDSDPGEDQGFLVGPGQGSYQGRHVRPRGRGGSKHGQSSGSQARGRGQRGRGRGHQARWLESRDRGRGTGGDPGRAATDMNWRMRNTRLENSFAAWKKQTLGKRVNFGVVGNVDHAEGKGDTKMAKSVRVY